ncbi:hypothetical protein JCM8547_008757 [Rhodosporidiobolus lusitaniae]
MAAVAPETSETQEAQQKPGWASTYDALNAKLPGKFSNSLPSSSTVAAGATLASDRLSTLSATGRKQLGELGRASSQRASEIGTASSASANKFREMSAQKLKDSQEAWLSCCYSVTNETQVALNVALCQVGPLYYEVIAPGDTFERRIPNLPFALELRPFPESPYNSWSTTWPVLAVTGPVVAAASLLAIPFVAVAAGGSALASLTGIGSSIAAGATATAESVTASAATATALVAKASSLPGARHVKTKLSDAARKAVGEHISRDKIQEHVVRYITERGVAAGAGAATEAEVRRITDAEDGDRKKKQRREGKVDEVEVTGLDVEKVLRCETGKSAVDKALAKAFKKLSTKSGLREYKTDENPVLRVVGGPELETRTPPSSFLHPHPSPKTFLVFYPLVVLHAPASVVRAEPVPASEVPPTEDETRIMKEGKVVEKYETAEKVAATAPAPTGEAKEGGKEMSEQGKKDFEQAVEEAQKEEGETGKAEEGSKGQGKEGEEVVQKKKGWFW